MIVQLLRSPGLAENTSEAFRCELVAMGQRLMLDAGLIGAVMSFETGGKYDPALKNLAGSGATGLIQFMPSTAKILGTTTDELAQMTAVEQLHYVEKFFQPWAGRLHAPLDYYLAVFSPAFVGKPASTVMYSAPSKAYEQNAGLDADGDGHITVGDVGKKFGGLVASAQAKAPIPVDLGACAEAPPVEVPGSGGGGIFAAGALALLLLAAARARRSSR